MLRVKNQEEFEVLESAVRTYVFRHRGKNLVMRPTFKELVEVVFAVINRAGVWGDIVYNEDATDQHIETIRHIQNFDGPPQTIGYPQIANTDQKYLSDISDELFLNSLIKNYPDAFSFPHIRALWTLLPVLMFRAQNRAEEFKNYNPEQDILDFVKEYPFFVGEFEKNSSADSSSVSSKEKIESKREFNFDYQIWLIGTGAKGEFWNDFMDQNIIALGWDDLDNFTSYSSLSEIRKALKSVAPDASNRNRASEISEFESQIKLGDFVFARYGTSLLGLGIVLSAYQYREHGPLKHFRRVVWINTDAKALPSDSGISQAERFTLRKLTRNKNNYEKLREFVEHTCNQTGPSGIRYSGSPDEAEQGQIDSTTETDKAPTGQAAKDGRSPNHWWLNIGKPEWYKILASDSDTWTITIPETNFTGQSITRHVNQGDKIVVYRTAPEHKMAGILTVVQKMGNSGTGQDFVVNVSARKFPGASHNVIRYHEDLSNLKPIKSPQGKLFKLSEEEYETILSLADTTDDDASTALPAYSIKDELDKLFVDENFIDNCINNLKRKKNIILQGPPGVGKSYIANKLAWELIGRKDDSKIARVQFHQSFGYEEFIHGYRPAAKGGFALRPGIFLKFVYEAHAKPGTPHVFIIDEINRGNLSRILGECMSTIEHDKRNEEHGVQLLHTASHEPKFWVPDNLYIIGMMNTADRSISLVDYALRRRFAFIDMEPQFDSDKFNTLLKVGSDEEKTQIKDRFKELNKQIEGELRLGKNYLIGHSYFCTENGLPEGKTFDRWYNEIIEHEIRPLLHSYLPDDHDGVEDLLKMRNSQQS